MPKRPQRSPGSRPTRIPAPPELPAELKAVLDEVRQVTREAPEGWAVIADVLRQQEDMDFDLFLPVLARSMGKDALPLLRGLSVDEDERVAAAALRALPLLGTRAAGEALAVAYAAYPEGERARLAWQGVEALRAQGINVAVPEPAGARGPVARFQVRESWELIPDGVGSSQATVRVQDRYGVWYGLLVVWNERAGIKDAFLSPLSRREWEEALATFGEDELAAVQVPPDYSRWQVARLRQVNAQSGFPLPEGLQEWDEIIGPPPDDYEPPDPLAAVRSLPEAELGDLQAQIPEVMEEFLMSWALEPADCRPWLEDYQAHLRRDSSDEESELALQTLAAAIARALVTPELVARYRDRLLDAARKLEWSDYGDSAPVLAAAVLEIDRSADPADAGFFRDQAVAGLDMCQEMLENGVDPEAERYDPMRVIE